jgi:hypothetical protein
MIDHEKIHKHYALQEWRSQPLQALSRKNHSSATEQRKSRAVDHLSPDQNIPQFWLKHNSCTYLSLSYANAMRYGCPRYFGRTNFASNVMGKQLVSKHAVLA